MTIVFDLDGTVFSDPKRFGILMALCKGHKRIVLTAAAGELPPRDRPKEVNRRLAEAGLSYEFHFDDVICCEGHEKGLWCSRLAADFIIDDSQHVVDDVRKKSPSTIILHVK